MFLKIENLSCHYGVIQALHNVSIEIEKKGIYAIIGANGAGKSSLINVMAGLVPSSSGHIVFDGVEITDLQPHEVIKAGISVCPEGRKIFQSVSVYENLLAGAYIVKDKREVQQNVEMVFEFFPRLAERRKQLAGTLSGGEQQMLAVGRALLSRPQLMMMDEPSLGLAPLIIKDIFNIIQEINSRGMTILLIEQNANMALKVAHQAYVLETGKITMSGTGQELLENPDIKAAYLGKKRNQK